MPITSVQSDVYVPVQSRVEPQVSLPSSIETSSVMAALEISSPAQGGSDEEVAKVRRDEYVPDRSAPVRSALYNVTNVVRDRQGRTIQYRAEHVSTLRENGAQFDKIVDILLPMGRKNLSIFREA